MVHKPKEYVVRKNVPKQLEADEITKKGYVNTQAELEGIHRAKVKARKLKKHKIRLRRKDESKHRQDERKAYKELLHTLDYSDSSVIKKDDVKKVETNEEFKKRKEREKAEKTRVKPNFTKMEKAEFRKYMSRRKAHKKAKKKARQAARSGVSTESGALNEFPEVTFKKFLETHSLVGSHGKVAFQYINLIYQLYNAPSKIYVVSILSNFISFHDISMDLCADIVDTIQRSVERLLNRPRIFSESFSDFLEAGVSNIKFFFSSSLLNAVRKLIVIVATHNIFTDEQRQEVYKYFKPIDVSNMDVVGVVTIVLKSLATVSRFVEKLWQGADLTEAFFTTDPINTVLSKAKTLLSFKDRLYFGLPRDQRMCAKMFYKDACELRDTMKQMKKRIVPVSTAATQLSSLKTELDVAIEEVQTKLNRSTRPTPIGVVIAGDPGIGKSTVANFVYQTHSFVKGRKFEYCHVFERVVTSQYWDGYDVGTPYIHYSEVGAQASQIIRMKGDPAVQELTSVIDSLPFCCDMSAVEDKGKVYCTAEMVVIDTNNPDMNIDDITQNPAAYRRRFLYIIPHVKAQYRGNGSALDPNKCDDAENFYDRWNFDVYIEEPHGVKTSTRRFLLRADSDKSDIHALEVVLKAYFEEKIKRGQEDVENKLRSYYDCDEKKEVVSESGHIQNMVRFGNIPRTYQDYKDYAEYFFRTGVWIAMLIVGACAAALEFCILSIMNEFSERARQHFLYAMIFFLWFGGHVSVTLLFICASLFRINKSRITANFLERRMRRSIREVKRCVKHASEQAFVLGCSFAGCIPKYRSHFEDFNAATKILVLVATAMWFFGRKKQTPKAAAETGVMDEIDAKFECGSSYPRVKVKNQKIWNVVKLQPSLHKSDTESLHKKVARNARRVVINKSHKTFCLGLFSNIAIINRHALGDIDDDKGAVLEVSVKGGYSSNDGYHATLVRKKDLHFLCTDLVVVYLDGVCFTDIRVHFPETLCDFSHARSFIGNDEVRATGLTRFLDVIDPVLGTIALENVVEYKWSNHNKGSCGLPIVGKRDSGSCILGLHSAGHDVSDSAYAVAVSRHQIARALKSLKPGVGCVYSQSGRTGIALPHFKSPVRYEDLGAIEYYGALHSVSLRQKSKLMPTVFRKHLEEIFHKRFDFIRNEYYVPPLMQPVGNGEDFKSPYNLALRKMAKDKIALDTDVAREAISVITSQILENLSDKDIPVLQPLTIKCAINGVPNDPYIRRIDVNKAAGYGLPGKKNKYLIRHDEDDEIWDEPGPELLEEIKKIVSCYMRGQNYGPVYKATLKDEPRLLEKAIEGKTRVFYASPFAHLIVSRMFLAPFYSLMVEFSEDFYCALGIDMHREGHLLYERLVAFSTKILEGDWGGFDTSMIAGVAMSTSDIICFILEALGYTQEQMAIVRGILSDGIYPLIDFIGELLMAAGIQPSGKYATAEDNCLRNLFILLYLWIKSGRNARDFFHFMKPCTYGDDVLVAVKDETFGAVTFAKLADEHLNMKFTSSAKSDVVVEFISPSAMTFLKRTFVFSNKLNRIVCPLNYNSIYKALEWRLPSVLNEETQMEQTLCSMAYEIFLNNTDDRHVYDAAIQDLTHVLQDAYPDCVFSIPKFDDVYAALSCSDKKLVLEGRREIEKQVSTESGVSGWDDDVSDDENTTLFITFGRVMTKKEWSANKIEIIENQIFEMSQELKEAEQELESLSDPMPGMNYRQIMQTPLYANDADFRQQVGHYYHVLNVTKALRSSQQRLWAFLRREKSHLKVVTESGMMEDTKHMEEDISNHENVEEIAGDIPDEKIDITSSTLKVGQANDLDMSEFLSRPLAVTSFSVATGADVSYNVDIWDYFLSHPSVRAKLRNYAYLRANLVLRVSISATPFHYSKVLVSYQPLAGFNENLSYLEPQLGTSSRFQALTYLSQSRFARVLDVKSNAPLQMKVPFISPQPMLRLFNDSPLILPDTASYNDAVGFGKLYIQSINPVQCASATPTPISVFVYAYLEDVELGAPTGTVIDIGTESGPLTNEHGSKSKPKTGKEHKHEGKNWDKKSQKSGKTHDDERKTGPVEKFATRAAEVSAMLTAVPQIAPLAEASAMVFSGVAGLSSLFGYSVPTMDNEPLRVKNQPYQNGAQVIGYDTGKRLTLDPKQELSVDPRDSGTDMDEMALAYLTQHESLLDTFAWADGTTPLSTSIWMAPVNPGVVKRHALGAPTPYLVVPTPLSFTASFFDVWRGDIDFRFEVNCSKYHRGKLAFYFEPNIAQNVVIDTVLDMNKQFIKIIDIQEVQDITFRVQWAFPRAWAKTLTSSLLGDLGTVGFLGASLFDHANGYVAVTPFTSLQSPDGSDISINVYISSPDMRFNQFIDTKLPTVRPSTESGRLSSEEVSTLVLNESTATMEHITEMHYGELPVSFRSLLKRFVSPLPMGETQVNIGASPEYINYFRQAIYPEPRPQYNGSSSTQKSLYGYLRYAYLGMKGGVRRRIGTLGDLRVREGQMLRVELEPPSTTVNTNVTTSNTMSRLVSSINGTLTYVPNTNGGIEFELPNYTNNLFGISFSNDPYPDTSIVENQVTREFSVYIPTHPGPTKTWATVTRVHVTDDMATGEDFSFFLFSGAPAFIYT